MSTSIQDLDRIFADHFRVNPLIAHSAMSKEGQRKSSQSFESADDAEEAITPTYPPVALPMPPQEVLDDPVRAQKLKELYQNIADLYVDKQAVRKADTEVSPPAFHRDRQASARTITVESCAASIYHDGEQDESRDQTPELSPASTQGMSLQQEESAARLEEPVRLSQDSQHRVRDSESGLGLQVRLSGLDIKEESPEPLRNNRKKHVSMSEDKVSPTSSPLRQPIAPPTDDKKVLLPLEEISFKAIQLPDHGISETDAKDLLDKSFPHLCEVPTHMVGENGELLPPTKKEETSLEERQARKEALILHFRGKKTHSLVKSQVILESRTAVWKRVGSAQRLQHANRPLPAIPDPWALECYHQDLDRITQDGKAKRAFELKSSRTEGLCNNCHGKRVDTCSTCKGEEADECWWCSGTGKKKNLRDCERCVGEGKLKCQACAGKLVQPCEPCKGEGDGLYAAMVHIKVRKVDFPAVPTSIVVMGSDVQDPENIRVAAIERTKEMIDRLIATNDARGKIPFRPLMASCSWEVSSSSLLEVEVSQTSKLLSKKGSMSSGLRRSASLIKHHKKPHFTTRFFMLPTDADLRVVELSKEEFSEALLPEIPRNRHGHHDEAHDVSHSDDLPEAVGAMTPKVGAFRKLAPASIQLSSAPGTPLMTPRLSPDHEASGFFESSSASSPGRPTRSELRGHRRPVSSSGLSHRKNIHHGHHPSGQLGTPF